MTDQEPYVINVSEVPSYPAPPAYHYEDPSRQYGSRFMASPHPSAPPPAYPRAMFMETVYSGSSSGNSGQSTSPGERPVTAPAPATQAQPEANKTATSVPTAEVLIARLAAATAAAASAPKPAATPPPPPPPPKPKTQVAPEPQPAPKPAAKPAPKRAAKSKASVAPAPVAPPANHNNNLGSLGARLKRAGKEAKRDKKDLMPKVMEIVGTTPELNLISILIFCGLCISMIYHGARYLTACPVQRFIPISLIIVGSLLLFEMILDIGCYCHIKKTEPDEVENYKTRHSRLRWMSVALSLNWLGWFIASSYFVYHTYIHKYPSSDPTNSKYCDSRLFLAAFWMINAHYILIACIIVFYICMYHIAKKGGED